jgi:hypothetical protein
MKSRHNFYAVPFTPLASRSGDWFPGPEQALKSWRAERDYHFRADECKLAKQERLAGFYLIAFWSSVSGRTALDDVGDVNIFASKTDGFNNLVEELPGSAYERPTGGVFFGARTLAYECELRLRVPFSEYNSSPVFVKSAARAIANLFANFFKRSIT